MPPSLNTSSAPSEDPSSVSLPLPTVGLTPPRRMRAEVHRVEPGSIAEEIGFQPGDIITAINGRCDLEDMLDYQFEVTGSELVALRVQHADGSESDTEIEKEADEELGLVFASPVFTSIKTCNNRCPFCFIDQQPKGLRPSLYIKDDDYRLSYFNNTYITLTNLTPHDIERIERLRPGPLYISVHSTVPEVRQQMLMNPEGGNILEKLQWLCALEIPCHCQIVICPGINDGEALSTSIKELLSLGEHIASIAIVPVGLTQYREGLPQLNPVSKSTAQDVIHRVQQIQAALNLPNFADRVFLSDEFYYQAGIPLPQYEAYGDFPQLDDGVGTARMLEEGFWHLAAHLPATLADIHAHYTALFQSSLPQAGFLQSQAPKNSKNMASSSGEPHGAKPTGNEPNETASVRKVLLLTGQLGAMVLNPLAQRLNQIAGLYVDVKTLESHFWGEAISVAGLITGQDILQQLSPEVVSGYQSILIPAIMLRHGTLEFLDGTSVAEVSAALRVPLRVVQDPYNAVEFLHWVLLDQPLPHSGTSESRWIR